MKNWSAFFSGHSLEQDTISSQRQMRAFDSLISRACQYESDQKERRACVEKLFLLRREPFRDEVIAGRKTHVKQGSRSSRMYPSYILPQERNWPIYRMVMEESRWKAVSLVNAPKLCSFLPSIFAHFPEFVLCELKITCFSKKLYTYAAHIPLLESEFAFSSKHSGKFSPRFFTPMFAHHAQ